MNKILRIAWLLFVAIAGVSMVSHAETKKILVVGNSFSFDAALQEFLPIVQSAGDDIVLGFPYKGGTTLELHWRYITGNQKIYNYYKIEGGKMTSTGGSSRLYDASIITDEDWDVVVIQTDHNYSGAYDHYFPYLDNIINYLRENLTNKDAKFYLYMTWAYQNGSAKMIELINKGLYTDQMDQYTKIVDCAFRAAEQSGIGQDNVIPGGTAVQNGRTSYIGDSYNRDGYHMDLSHGRYTVALAWYEKIFGKSAIGIPYHPASMTDFCAEMCQHAVHEAILNPKQITSLEADYGVNPDAVPVALDRPVLVNFGVAVGASAVSQYAWNDLTTVITGASKQNLYNGKGYGTEVKVVVGEPFDGVSVGGSTQTETDLDMPVNASKSSFYGTKGSSVIISGLYPGQAYDMSVFASVSGKTDNLEAEYTFVGANTASAILNPADNTAQVAKASDVVADEMGRITLTIKATDKNTDANKTYYLGALMMTPHLEVPGKVPVYINFTTPEKPAEEGAWNNVTSHLAGTAITDLINGQNSATGISLNVTKGFAGITENGATSTTTALNMPANASSTGFWVNGIEKDGVLVDNAEIVFSGFDPNETYDFYMFGSQMDATEVHEAEYSTFGKVENYIGLNGNNNDSQVAELTGVVPDADGNIRFTVTPGATSEDAYKVGYINAMAIMVPGIIKVVPFEPVAEGPWDGKSMIEPARDAAGNCVIYAGAELAWVANQVNQGKIIPGVKIAKDIDLGNQPWTPIGYGKAYWYGGKIDGQGYKVYNLYINKSDLKAGDKDPGFVGGTNSSSCEISNLYLSGKIEIPAGVTDKVRVGSVIGTANAFGRMTNCHSDVEISIKGGPGYVGGLIGLAKTSEMKSCSYSGAIVIEEGGKVTNGVGGLLGSTNSTTAGIEAVFTGCYFTGSITNKSASTPLYAGGINSYSNLKKGAETLTDNYAVGKIDCTGSKGVGAICGLKGGTPSFSCENNYFISDYTIPAYTGGEAGGEARTWEQFHSGEVAYALNGDQMEFLFGQDLDDANSMPVVYNGTNRVYKTVFMVEDTEYATLYHNAELRLPEPPEGNFGGWADEKGNRYDASSVVETDLVLYALKSSGVDNIEQTLRISIRENAIQISSDAPIGRVSVFSMDGRTVMARDIHATSASIDLSGLQAGVYLVENKANTLKFLKK